MLKKLFSIAALTSLLVGGLSATQANAAAADVDIANVASPRAELTINAQSEVEVVIPAGLKTFTITQGYYFDEAFLIEQQSKRLSSSLSINLPNGTPVAKSLGGTASTSYYAGLRYGNLYNNSAGTSVQPDYSTQSITVPANATGFTGGLAPTFYLQAPYEGFLPAGTYTYSLKLTSTLGQVVEEVPSSAAGLTMDPRQFLYSIPGTSFVTPDFIDAANVYGTLCADPTKITVGDTVTARIVFDGAELQNANNVWSTRTGYKSYLDSGFRDQGFGNTATVTQFDLDWGLAVDTNGYVPDLVAGSSQEFSYRLFDQNEEDVSGSCAPSKPSTPNVSFTDGLLRVSGQYALGSSARSDSECTLYESTAPTVIISTTSTRFDFMNRINYTCQFSGLTSNKTYLVKFRDTYQGAFSEYSDPREILIPSAGYTVTSSYLGVVEAKKIVKVSSNVLPIEDNGIRTSIAADGKGGFFTVGAQSGSCPPTCGTSAVRIRNATATAFNSTFAGSGSIVLGPFALTNPFASGLGYYGTNKDKWAIPVNGFTTGSTNVQTQITFGSTTEATTTTKQIVAADVSPICEAASSGYAARSGPPLEVSVLGTPTNDVLLAITCYKTYTLNGNPSQLPLPILATMNPSTGALTFKAAMGTPGAGVNSVSVRYSVNPNAASGEALVTAFATSSLVTQINNFPLTNAGTVADHTVIRLDSSFNVLSTTASAWGTSGGQISADAAISVPLENTGKVYMIATTGSTPSVITFDGPEAGTPLAIDVSASEIAAPTIAAISLGHAVPYDATVLPVQVTAIGKDAAGWINLTTGVLTTGEVLTYTTSSGNGLAKFWVRGADNTPYLIYSDSAAPANLTVLKWIDPSYVAPVGPVPAVTSKDVKYSKNTPTAGAKVTLTGTNLDAVISAKIGDNTATLGTKTATSLQLTIPTATAAGTVDITLTTATGDTVVDTFTYVGAGVAQTVTVAALSSAVTVGDADLALSATVAFSPVDAGTAGAITWSSDTPTVCSIVANKARLLTAGTCTVKATAAASGLLLAGSGTQSTTVSAAPAAAQTVTLTGPTKVVVDLDGFDVVSSASSRLAVKFTTSTPTICTVSSVGRVVAIAVGTCEITSTQAGNSSWLAASKTLTITVAKTPTTPLTEKGDIKKPLALSKTGTYLKNGDASLAWNRAKGTFAVKLSVVYVGPVKASISFKVGSKTYTCSTKFGLLKKQSSSKLLTITSPNLCAAKTEKTQLAALKKITTSTVVTVTIVRDMYFPTTYKKIRTKTRVLYAKLG